jgi:hypothetical protein
MVLSHLISELSFGCFKIGITTLTINNHSQDNTFSAHFVFFSKFEKE